MFGLKRKVNNNSDYLIRMSGVVKAYETEAGQFLALKSVNLIIGQGEFVAVVGKSGSGKSTLINMLSGIDRPTSGEVYIAGNPIHTYGEGRMSRWRGRNLGIVFQFFQLLPTLTAIENVMLPMDFCHLYSPGQRRKRAYEVLDQVGIASHANKLPGQLSGGEQQRVAIARALANDPPIILADEPTGNLDSRTSEQVFQLFEGLIASGKTIVMVTHDNDLTRRVKRTIVISDGELIEEYLARAFPTLDHPQLIMATSKLQPRRYPAGKVIIDPAAPDPGLYFISRGQVEVVGARRGADGTVLEMGQCFNGAGLKVQGSCVSVVRAIARIDTELAVLDTESLKELGLVGRGNA